MWNGVFTVRTKSKTRAVCDAGPIIHLDELNCLYLLDDFDALLLPESVCEEVNQHRVEALTKMRFSLIPVSSGKHADPVFLAMCRLFSLGAGESDALLIMEENPEAIFLTADASARVVATQMGFKVHGTIGILIRSIRRGEMEFAQVLGLLQEIPSKSSLHVKRPLLEEIIVRIRSEFSLQ